MPPRLLPAVIHFPHPRLHLLSRAYLRDPRWRCTRAHYAREPSTCPTAWLSISSGIGARAVLTGRKVARVSLPSRSYRSLVGSSQGLISKARVCKKPSKTRQGAVKRQKNYGSTSSRRSAANPSPIPRPPPAGRRRVAQCPRRYPKSQTFHFIPPMPLTCPSSPRRR